VIVATWSLCTTLQIPHWLFGQDSQHVEICVRATSRHFRNAGGGLMETCGNRCSKRLCWSPCCRSPTKSVTDSGQSSTFSGAQQRGLVACRSYRCKFIPLPTRSLGGARGASTLSFAGLPPRTTRPHHLGRQMLCPARWHWVLNQLRDFSWKRPPRFTDMGCVVGPYW
jgi:hypothetical protein